MNKSQKTNVKSEIVWQQTNSICIFFSSPEKGGGPKVGWTLDQKESIKSALFIGYVIMQVPIDI